MGEPVPLSLKLLCCAVLGCAAGTVEDALLRWLRAAELTCDRAALLVAQDPAVVIGALMKLAGGSPAFAHELSVDAFLQQVCVVWLGWLGRWDFGGIGPAAVCAMSQAIQAGASHDPERSIWLTSARFDLPAGVVCCCTGSLVRRGHAEQCAGLVPAQRTDASAQPPPPSHACT